LLLPVADYRTSVQLFFFSYVQTAANEEKKRGDRERYTTCPSPLLITGGPSDVLLLAVLLLLLPLLSLSAAVFVVSVTLPLVVGGADAAVQQYRFKSSNMAVSKRCCVSFSAPQNCNWRDKRRYDGEEE
jgi:hypothetical protein